MKFWKSFKSSSGLRANGPSNRPEEDTEGSGIDGDKRVSNTKRFDQNRKGNSSQLHSVSNNCSCFSLLLP